MAVNIDLSDASIGEMIDLAQALGCATSKEAQEKMRAIATRLEQTGDIDLDHMIPFVWIAARQSRPGLTLAQARNLPLSEVNALLPTPEPPKAAQRPTRARR